MNIGNVTFRFSEQLPHSFFNSSENFSTGFIIIFPGYNAEQPTRYSDSQSPAQISSCNSLKTRIANFFKWKRNGRGNARQHISFPYPSKGL